MPALDALHTKQTAFDMLLTPYGQSYAEHMTAAMRGEEDDPDKPLIFREHVNALMR